jgi:hypothetical protein
MQLLIVTEQHAKFSDLTNNSDDSNCKCSDPTSTRNKTQLLSKL